MVEDLEIN